MTHLYLRAETKEFEKRTALTPRDAGRLILAGHEIFIESSSKRIFKDKEYTAQGCTLVPPASWMEAPQDAFILGLKELPEAEFPLTRKHIYFSHCYKQQRGAKQILNRFKKGKGKVYDLEFLVDEKNARVCAFGYWAGIAGAAISLQLYANHILERKRPVIPFYKTYAALKEELEETMTLLNKAEKNPSVLVVGANGRSGRGATKLCQDLAIIPDLWDIEDTQNPETFNAFLKTNIFLNCTQIDSKVSPFITHDALELEDNLQLKVIGDIACHAASTFNPLPIYLESTNFTYPSLPVTTQKGTTVEIMAIDNLPTYLPRESSNDFSESLYEYLVQLLDTPAVSQGVWRRAEAVFLQHIQN